MELERFKGELIFFSAKDGLRLQGFLLDHGKEDAVIFVHGMGGNFYKIGFLEGARIFSKHRISYFSINTRGAEIAKDFKDLENKHHLLGTAFERFEDSILDIEGAIDVLESRGFENFHLMGHSTGCQKILYYAYKTKDHRVKSLIHISPAEDYEIWRNQLGKDFEEFVNIAIKMVEEKNGKKIIIPLYEKTGEIWSAERFLSFAFKNNWEARMFNYDSLDIFSKVNLPTLIALGKEDEYFIKPLEWYAKRLKDSYKGKKLKIEIIPGDHSFHGYENMLFERISNFIKEI